MTNHLYVFDNGTRPSNTRSETVYASGTVRRCWYGADCIWRVEYDFSQSAY